MFTPFNIFLAVLAIAVVLLVNRVFLGPKLETWLTESKRSVVDRRCDLALVKALWAYRKGDYDLDVPPDIMKFLKTCFSSQVLEYALHAARFGHVDIYINSRKKAGGGTHFKYLAAYFEEGEFAFALYHDPLRLYGQ